MPSTFKPVKSATVVGRDKDFVAGLQAAVAAGVVAVKRECPVRTGRFRDSITGAVVLESTGPVGKVFTKDFRAHWIEFGSLHNYPAAPFAKGAASVGLPLSFAHLSGGV